jgi:NDP-sugar pyrophosphorylase family protein
VRDLHIILPMAGLGSRFAKVGITTPKPLIQVDGRPMVLKALSSLDGIAAKKRFTVIIREEHGSAHGLQAMLHEALPEANIVATRDAPIGAVRDAYRAKPYLKSDDGVIVLDCDLWFESPEYNDMVETCLSGQSELDGGLLTFPADNPRYSYAEIGPDGLVTRTAEKVVISNRAITGAYFFGTATSFIDAAEALLATPLAGGVPEYYLSNLYNVLLSGGAKIGAANAVGFASFGTPEELKAYETAPR